MICYLDLETRSAANLPKTGAYRYFEDPTADVLCAAYAFGDGEVQTWVRGDPAPEAFNEHVRAGGIVSAHNAAFEYWALLLILGPRYGWEVPRIEQLSDTMAFAAALSIPQSLAGAAGALGLEEEKDSAGKRLIRKFSVPRRARKGEVPGKLYWNEPADHPEEFQQFVDYCRQDVVVERAVKSRMVPLSDAEQKVWEFNLKMNTRGVLVDLELVGALLKITDDAKAKLDAEMARATDWEITACSQVSALTGWLRAQGVDAEKLNKNAIEELLDQELPEKARRAVELRKEAAKTSTAKLTAMTTAASMDGRVRGVHAYHGASTGRWAGRLVQCQNMPRGTGTIKNPELAVPHLLKADADLVELLYGSPMSAASDCLRACLVASPGHRLMAADYSSIEGRVTAWVAGEEEELEAYRAVDNKTGPGIYEIAAGGIFNRDPYEVTKDQRQVGKAACIAEGTLVVVRNIHGQITAKPIQDVQITDLAWDGEDWVEHGGVVCNGERECVELNGTKLTPDHLIWCGASTGWVEAAQVVSSESIRLQASATAAECWSFPDTWSRMAEDYRRWSSSATAAGPNTASPLTLFRLEEAPAATPAQKKRPSALGRSTTCITRGLAQMWSIARDCSTGFLQSILDARTLRAGNGPLMAGAVSAAGGPTSMATSVLARGAEPASSRQCAGDTKCSGIWSAFRAGINQSLSLIVSTMTGATSRATFGSQLGAGTPLTSAEWTISRPECGSSKPKLRVYDLVNAGPRARFTVFSADGPLIVHNCLALGFGGGVMAFHAMASVYGVDMTPVYPVLKGSSTPEVWERAIERYEECCERGDTGTDLMTREAWIASEVTKVNWRAKHPATEALWRGLEDAALEAVQKPGTVTSYSCVSYLVRKGFLWCRLPSGRCLAYGNPKIKDRKTPWGAVKPAVTALGVNSVTKRWERSDLYGGLLTENVVQAIARDLMANGMLKAEEAGYPIVLTIHDEAVADVPHGHGSLKEFEALLCDLPEWAKGMPVVAEGYIAQRYRKD